MSLLRLNWQRESTEWFSRCPTHCTLVMGGLFKAIMVLSLGSTDRVPPTLIMITQSFSLGSTDRVPPTLIMITQRFIYWLRWNKNFFFISFILYTCNEHGFPTSLLLLFYFGRWLSHLPSCILLKNCLSMVSMVFPPPSSYCSTLEDGFPTYLLVYCWRTVLAWWARFSHLPPPVLLWKKCLLTRYGLRRLHGSNTAGTVNMPVL